MDEYEKALKDFSQAFELDPNPQKALALHYETGFIFLITEKPSEALEEFNECLFLDPDDITVILMSIIAAGEISSKVYLKQKEKLLKFNTEHQFFSDLKKVYLGKLDPQKMVDAYPDEILNYRKNYLFIFSQEWSMLIKAILEKDGNFWDIA